MNEINEKCIDICNKLLRGERSAVETYDIAIEKYKDDPKISELGGIREEHVRSVIDLENNVRSMSGVPSTDAGLWGATTKVIQHAANLFGEDSAIASLKNGEEHGLENYEDALGNEDTMPACKDLVRTELLPRTRRHIASLDRLENVAD